MTHEQTQCLRRVHRHAHTSIRPPTFFYLSFVEPSLYGCALQPRPINKNEKGFRDHPTPCLKEYSSGFSILTTQNFREPPPNTVTPHTCGNSRKYLSATTNINMLVIHHSFCRSDDLSEKTTRYVTTCRRRHMGVIYRRRLLLVVVRMAGAFSVQ